MSRPTKASTKKRCQECINKMISISNFYRMKGMMTPAVEKKFARIFDDLHSLREKLER